MAELKVRIVGSELPGTECGEFRDVHVGVQRQRAPEGLVRADAAEAVWEFSVEVVQGRDGAADFRGPYVQGRPGERFVYLTWGERPDGGEFEMFRRAKIFLADVPEELVASGTVEGRLALTDASGMPVCAGVRAPGVRWGGG